MAYIYSEDVTYYVNNETKDILIENREPLIAGESISHYVSINLNSKYVDGVDISTMNIMVDWYNSGDDARGSTGVIDLIVHDDITFGWVVPKEACVTPGTLYFRVTAKGPDGYIWKTLDAEKKIEKSRIDFDTGSGNAPLVRVTAKDVEEAVKKIVKLTDISFDEINVSIYDDGAGNLTFGEVSSGSGSGVTNTMAETLYTILKKSGFTTQLTDAERTAFETAWGVQ